MTTLDDAKGQRPALRDGTGSRDAYPLKVSQSLPNNALQNQFDPAYPLTDLVPASYNPRRIDADALSRLRASIDALGLIKPVIVTTQKTLVAGHQRTVSMRALGLPTCPAFVLPPVGTTDEVRFNQLHNASDLDKGDEQVSVPASPMTGYQWVRHDQITCLTHRVKNAPKKTEIMRLLSKYGDWGSCVALHSGEVVVSGLYALACAILRRPLLVYYLPGDKRPLIDEFFGQSYGVFSYDHLPKTTWAQSLAQMMRLRPAKTGKLRKDGDPKGQSRTYENLVLPRLKPGLRVLDFGAGQMDYVKRLQATKHQHGVDIRGVEFYYRTGKHLNVPQVQKDIDALCHALETLGRFDLVVCDSVLNSVDTLCAEADVLTCLAALCKPGGTVIFSGRSRDAAETKEAQQTTNTNPSIRYVHFFDGDGFSAMYSLGVWRYQKFHTLPQIRSLAAQYFGGAKIILDSDGRDMTHSRGVLKASGWGVVATNTATPLQEDCLAALGREFDLPLPGGKSIGRSADIQWAFLKAKEREECT